MDFGDDDDFLSGGAQPAATTTSDAPAFEVAEDDAFGLGGGDAPAPAPAAGGFGDDDDFLGGGGNAQQQEQHQEEQPSHHVEDYVEEHDAEDAQPAAHHQEEQQQDDDFFGGGAAPAPAPAPAAPIQTPSPAASSSRAMESLEENPFTIWQKKHQAHLTEKSDASKIKADEAKTKAASWIKDFYQERSMKFEQVQRVNRDNEAEALSALDAGLSVGPSWERVCGLVDLQAKTDSRDTSRMRQVLLQVKAHPPPHMLAA